MTPTEESRSEKVEVHFTPTELARLRLTCRYHPSIEDLIHWLATGHAQRVMATDSAIQQTQAKRPPLSIQPFHGF